MKNFSFLILLIIILISAGCISDNQNNMGATATQTSTATIKQTVQTTLSPAATEEIIEPIVGIWKGTPEEGVSAAYCYFFENGDFEWSTSMGRDINIKPGSAAYELRVTEENKLFGFNFNPTPDKISRLDNGRYVYVPNASGSKETFSNLSWIKNGEDSNKVYYITKFSDGSRATDIVYVRADNSLLINSTGLRLERSNNFPYS